MNPVLYHIFNRIKNFKRNPILSGGIYQIYYGSLRTLTITACERNDNILLCQELISS